MTENAGAMIERGKIIHKKNDRYTVQSYSRQGITVENLPAMNGTTFNENDLVYFFLFNDGKGLILEKFDDKP